MTFTSTFLMQRDSGTEIEFFVSEEFIFVEGYDAIRAECFRHVTYMVFMI